MLSGNRQILWVVIPCFNEQEVLPVTSEVIRNKISDLVNREIISPDSRILLVDDGSRDTTWEIISNLSIKNNEFVGLKLSRNCGHQCALLAGLMEARKHADMIISMDSDLQDDIDVLDDFIREYYQGNEIVYGVRSKREKDSWFKRTTAESFYKLMRLMGVELTFNSADYRLMSARALNELSDFREVNLFLRGLVPLLGFNSTTVEYERKERFAGESKYPLRKMIAFAVNGITSFSIVPIRIVSISGAIALIVAAVVLMYSVIVKAIGNAEPGWTFIMCSIWFALGIQMLSLGIIGEYVGKIYTEVKARPRYIVETVTKVD